LWYLFQSENLKKNVTIDKGRYLIWTESCPRFWTCCNKEATTHTWINSPFLSTLLLWDEYNYHDATRKFIKKLSSLGNKVKRFYAIKKMIFSLINHRRTFDNIAKHDGSCIQTITTCKLISPSDCCVRFQKQFDDNYQP